MNFWNITMWSAAPKRLEICLAPIERDALDQPDIRTKTMTGIVI